MLFPLELNTSILAKQDYYDLIANTWSHWCRSVSNFPSLAKWWDEGKSLIKGLTIRYCCSRSQAKSQNRDLLVRLIYHLRSKVDAGSSSCIGPYHSALSELDKIDLDAAKGAQVRSQICWVEGETSSSYFFRL